MENKEFHRDSQILFIRAYPGARGGSAELVFGVLQESDGGYTAECLSESIFTEDDSWEELRNNAMEAVPAFFFDKKPPEQIRLHLVRDEVLILA
jgi:hypothetical protein